MTIPFNPRMTTFKDLERMAREHGEMGKFAIAQGLRPWQESSTQGRAGTDNQKWRRLPAPTHDQMMADLTRDLPAVVRRDPRDRYRVLVKRLFEDGKKTYAKHGYPVWPKSVQQELHAMGWEIGNPNLQGQVEALARKYLEEGANIQREKDRHKSALDWHGHTSA